MASPTERDQFIVRFDKSHACNMGALSSRQFHNRAVLYSLKTKQGLPVFWVLHPGYSANGWGRGTNIWRSLKLGSQQADLDEGQVPLHYGPTFCGFAKIYVVVPPTTIGMAQIQVRELVQKLIAG